MVEHFRQGDIVFLDFDPQKGHEQKGRRPAIVVSNNIFNRYSKLVNVCPITNTNKKHPFHIELDYRTKTTGVILCDQSRTLDLKARNATFEEALPDDILNEVVDMLTSFLERR